MNRLRWLLLGVLIFMVSILVYAWWREMPHDRLKVSFLDVGQGDSILIEASNGNQLLIDGGPNKSVLRGLGRHVPWYDRFIDVVVATHPDADHIGGLPFVLERFKVGVVLEPGVATDTNTYQQFRKNVSAEGVANILARRGMKIILDKETTFTVLYPDRDTTEMESNEASIVGKLEYRDISFLLTGDAPAKVEQALVYQDGARLQSTVLKAGHHGSKTSTSQSLLDLVSPTYAVISAGADNRYGHPHADVVYRLQRARSTIISTATSGDVTFYVKK